MKPDSRFGDYILFRKLSSSALGETFRAGRLQARAIDRVVLLHRFDGEPVDRGELERDAAGRDRLLELLEAPQFARGLAHGSVDGVPFVAYDYLLGRSLRETLRQSEEKATHPGLGYLLTLIDQIADSLSQASQVRLDGIPVSHGFLIPELLLLSAEGRVYPLGFSHAPALARQPALVERFAPYFAPEVRSGAGSASDVYSLAAVLFEGLTGKPPSPDRPTAEQVDQALFTTGGQPLPAVVQNLLKGALAPVAEARPDTRSFHRQLQQVLEATDDRPSQFQLAFFLHRLFRDELEAEAVEMRDEKTTHFDPVTMHAAVEDPPPATEPEREESPETELPLMAPPPRASRGARPFLSGLAIALTLALAAAGLTYWLRRSPAAAETTAESAAAEAAAAGDVQNEVRKLVADGAAELRDRLEEEYEPRLTQLRQEVAAARDRAAERDSLRTREAARAASQPPARQPPATEPPATEPSGAVAPAGEPQAVAAAVTPPERTRVPPASPPGRGLETGPPRQNRQARAPGQDREASTPPTGRAAADSPMESDPAETEPIEEVVASQIGPPAVTAPKPESPAPVEPESPEPKAPAAAPPAVDASVEVPDEPIDVAATRSSVGSESEDEEPAVADAPAVQYSPPRLLSPPRPAYPAAARQLKKSARVRIRVWVDEEGRAAETELMSEPVGFGFERAALNAASRSRWEPARRDGVATGAWAVLTIDFQP